MLGSLQLETRREPRPGKADQPAAGSSRAAGVTGEESFADRGPAPERRAACPPIRGMAPRITGQTGPERGKTCPGNWSAGGVPVGRSEVRRDWKRCVSSIWSRASQEPKNKKHQS